MRAVDRKNLPLYGILLLVLVANIGLWFHSRHIRPYWGNVPPVVSERSAVISALGDRQMAYRATGLMLQNIGTTGGKDQPLQNYNYDMIGKWLMLGSRLDPVANYLPALAAYYYSATQNKASLGPIVDYLAEAGMRPEPHKWRWLAQAVYLARFELKDLNKALDLAHKLANLSRSDMPIWTRQMPAFVMNAQGDKRASYALMMGILSSSGKDLSPPEILFIRDYICDQVLSPAEALSEPLCNTVKSPSAAPQ